jgi:hypothetical protein
MVPGKNERPYLETKAKKRGEGEEERRRISEMELVTMKIFVLSSEGGALTWALERIRGHQFLKVGLRREVSGMEGYFPMLRGHIDGRGSTYSMFVCLFVVLGIELRAYTLSHFTSPFWCWVFSGEGLANYLPGLASNFEP